MNDYEHEFYRAYAGLTDNTLVRRIWDWDDAGQRLRTRIPYERQVLYAWRSLHGGALLAAMAVNLHPSLELQAAAFGFVAPPGVCEILNVFRTHHYHGSVRAAYAGFVCGYGFADLVSRGFDVAVSTCTRRRLRPYLRLGASLLDQTSIDGEERFFLRWPIRALRSPALQLQEHGGEVAGAVAPA